MNNESDIYFAVPFGYGGDCSSGPAIFAYPHWGVYFETYGRKRRTETSKMSL